ncbi:MAG: MATE family efflux transporter [Comamonas sp.]
MSEFKTILRHALAIFAGQLATMAYGVTDTIVAGRHSEHALAALSIGTSIFVSVYISLMGVMQALLPTYAELNGAQKPLAVGRAVRQSLYLCAALTLLGIAIMLYPLPLLRWAQVPTELQPDVVAYLRILALAFPAAMLFRLYATLNQALGHPWLVTWLQLAGLAAKVPLSVWFVFGGAGLPALGLAGCAWATLCINVLLFSLGAWMLRRQVFYQPYALWQRIEKPDWPLLRRLLRLGLPAGATYAIEVTSFTAMALLIARMGTVSLAAHQVATNLAAVLYMFPLAMALAGSARTSHWLGAGRPEQARRVIQLAYKLTLGLAVLAAVLLVMVREPLAAVYSTNPAVVALAASTLLWIAAYHLVDAPQVLGSFLLRCYGVTMTPFAVYGLLLWGMALPAGFWLAYHGGGPIRPLMAPAAFWIAQATGLLLIAAVLGLLLARVSGRAAGRPHS